VPRHAPLSTPPPGKAAEAKAKAADALSDKQRKNRRKVQSHGYSRKTDSWVRRSCDAVALANDLRPLTPLTPPYTSSHTLTHPYTPPQAEKAKGEAAERQREMDERREAARIARQR
jgi:hypothetical protein